MVRTSSYNLGVNFATNKNKVTRIANDNHYINGPSRCSVSGVLGTSTVLRKASLSVTSTACHTAESWQNQEQIEAARQAGKAVLDNAQPGDCIWDDWNNDGVITYAEGDACDRHEIGNPNPDIMLGVNLGLQYEGL